MRPGSPVLEPALAAVPVIPEHELLRPIASGAYGQVWLARSALGTLRAVKIVRRDRFDRAEDFEREFRGLQRFEPVSRTHEALVDILQIGRQDDWFYYVMELADDATPKGEQPAADSTTKDRPSLPGSPLHNPHSAFHTPYYKPLTLRQRIRDLGFLPAAEALVLGRRLAAALAHLHAQGLVHRDVKPSNILYIGGQPKLADAGLVAAVDDARSLVGTPGYIPPEGPGTPQADIYGLGKVLYEAAFGKDRQDFPQLPPDLTTRSDHATLLELNEIIAKACDQDPRRRHANSESLLAELELSKRGGSVRRRRSLSHLWAVGSKVGLAASLLATIVVASAWVHSRIRDAELHSAVPGVDELVAEGDMYSLGGTPERLSNSLSSFSEAATLDPKCSKAFIGIFCIRMAQEDRTGKASSNLQRAAADLMRVSPNSAEAHIAAAFVKFCDRQLAEALEEARRATKMRAASKDGLGMVHLLYGLYLLNAGYTDDALREYRIAKQFSPADPILEKHLGYAYLAKRNFPEALKQFQKSVSLEERDSDAYESIGRVCEELGDFPTAIEASRQCDLKRGADPAWVKKFYDDLLQAFRERGAQGYWEKRLDYARMETPPDAHYLATLYARLNQTEAAYKWLQAAYDQGTLRDLYYDLCWNHSDPRFKEIAAKVGLRP